MGRLKRSLLRLIGKKQKKGVKEEPVPREIFIENLKDARDILKSLNTPYWLHAGVLLGYHREGDLLEHDNDLDLGCYIEDYSDEIVRVFVEHGWGLSHVFGEKRAGLELAFTRNRVKLDIFFFYKEAGRRWCGCWIRPRKKYMNLIKYYFDEFELEDVEFLGETFSVPADTLRYIETMYGKDWRTPVKDWDWAFGPPNAVGTDFFLKVNKKKRIR